MNSFAQIARQAVIFVLWTSFLYIGYQITNRHQFFPVNHLPMTAIDRGCPFYVWSIYPYFTLIGLMYAPIFYRSSENFRMALMAITVGVLINYLVFIFYPTVYPRPPLPEGDTLHHALYAWLTRIDTPANCFPSGHITSPFIAIHFLAREHVSRRWPIYGLFLLCAASILTTKQHYFVDILGGLATAGIGIAVAESVNRRLRDAGSGPFH